jgi:hypothetical protein
VGHSLQKRLMSMGPWVVVNITRPVGEGSVL